jgi:hypothetical protein
MLQGFTAEAQSTLRKDEKHSPQRRKGRNVKIIEKPKPLSYSRPGISGFYNIYTLRPLRLCGECILFSLRTLRLCGKQDLVTPAAGAHP